MTRGIRFGLLAISLCCMMETEIFAITVDCNRNNVFDSLDIAGGTSADCNSNAIPDECDIAEGTSDDCDSNGVPDECTTADCPPIEMVILLDVSGSMNAEVSAICNQQSGIRVAIDEINSNGPPFVDLQILLIVDSGKSGSPEEDAGTTGLRGIGSCYDGSVHKYGDTLPGLPEILGDCSGETDGDYEDWGPATAIVAERKGWTPGSIRFIMPVTDEGPRCGGNGTYDSGDTDAIFNAIPFVYNNSVIVSPVITRPNYDVSLMGFALALASGGAAGGRVWNSGDMEFRGHHT